MNATVNGTPFEHKYKVVDKDGNELWNLFDEALRHGKPQVFDGLIKKVGVMPKGSWDVAPEKGTAGIRNLGN